MAACVHAVYITYM